MKQIPKTTSALSTQIPAGLVQDKYTRSEYFTMLRDSLITNAYSRKINKIICSFNVGYLFNSYIHVKGGVKVKFTKKYDDLIFIGDEVIEVID